MKKTLKKLAVLGLTLSMLTGLSACSKGDEEVPYVLNPTEYILYQNIFLNGTGDQYTGVKMTKTGTFAVLKDSYNQTSRYYVWGYNDETKCCDWQWEFVPADPDKLPAPGSVIEMSGVFAQSDAALDGYWYENATVTVKNKKQESDYDLDLTSMSDTLERVQLANVSGFPADFEGQSVTAYGRILSPTTFQDPYYDGSWQQDFTSDDTIPAMGTMVIASGVFQNGVISDCSIASTERF